MRKLSALCLFVLFVLSCSSFIAKEHDEQLNMLEQHTYIMLKDVNVEQKNLARRQSVKIIITRGDDSIKVYAYEASVDILKSERVLILYLFADDFPEEKFDFDFFLSKLNEVIVRK
ncbi:MAG: hypothetical protein FWG92_04340 [Leptospirales bacterium]|nr:hypothetical protein [Leptospirales bacterium]